MPSLTILPGLPTPEYTLQMANALRFGDSSGAPSARSIKTGSPEQPTFDEGV